MPCFHESKIYINVLGIVGCYVTDGFARDRENGLYSLWHSRLFGIEGNMNSLGYPFPRWHTELSQWADLFAAVAMKKR